MGVTIVAILVFVGVVIASIIMARWISEAYITCISWLITRVHFFNVSKQGCNTRKNSDYKINSINILEQNRNSFQESSNTTKLPTVGNSVFNPLINEIPVSKDSQNKDGQSSTKNRPGNFIRFVPINHIGGIIKRYATKCKRNRE